MSKLIERTDYPDIDGLDAHAMISLMNSYIDKFEQYGEIKWIHYYGESPHIEYTSPKTKEESEREKRIAKQRRDHERAEYERLKEKYGE